MSKIQKAPVMEPRIVCAANRYKNGIIIIGVRHWDEFMHAQSEAYGLQYAGHPEQGFIDQNCKFYTREEARKLAESNGQRIASCGGDSKELYSENLY